MSAAFKIALEKKKQNDLRKLMSEKKSSRVETKIEHPLAKYDSLGQLTCILCKSVVKSDTVWPVHINSKKHKENVQAAKQLKEQLEKQALAGSKRTLEVAQSDVPAKKLKGILKNSSTTVVRPQENGTKVEEKSSSGLPSDFFDSGSSKAAKSSENKPEPMEVEEEKLPEGFFDDPVKDAKAHNKEYKDPNDEEWERFQKEIKEATSKSMAIISEEQEEATVERQIDEIDEQMRNWSRVLNLERKKETVQLSAKVKKEPQVKKEPGDSDEDAEDDGNFDEYLDWRAKKSHK